MRCPGPIARANAALASSVSVPTVTCAIVAVSHAPTDGGPSTDHQEHRGTQAHLHDRGGDDPLRRPAFHAVGRVVLSDDDGGQKQRGQREAADEQMPHEADEPVTEQRAHGNLNQHHAEGEASALPNPRRPSSDVGG